MKYHIDFLFLLITYFLLSLNIQQFDLRHSIYDI